MDGRKSMGFEAHHEIKQGLSNDRMRMESDHEVGLSPQ